MIQNVLKLFSLASITLGSLGATAATAPQLPTPGSSAAECDSRLRTEDHTLLKRLVDANILSAADAKSGGFLVILDPDQPIRAELLPVPGMSAQIYDASNRLAYTLNKNGGWQEPRPSGDPLLNKMQGVLNDERRVYVHEDQLSTGKVSWTVFAFNPVSGRGGIMGLKLGDTIEMRDGRRLVQGANGLRVAPPRGSIRLLAAQAPAPLSKFLSWAQFWMDAFTWDQKFPNLDEVAKASVTKASIANDSREYIAFVGPKGPRDRWVMMFEWPSAVWTEPRRVQPPATLKGGLPLIVEDGRWYLRDDDPGVEVEPVRPKTSPTPSSRAPMALRLELAD